MSFGRLTTAQIESGPLRKTQRTTARSPIVTFFWVAANVWFRASIKSSQTELPPVSSPETVINVAFLTDDNR